MKSLAQRIAKKVQAHRQRRFDEAGDTLIEVLFTLLILGICVAGMLTAFSTSIAASAEQRGLVTLNTLVRDGSSELFTDFQANSSHYIACAPPTSYQPLVATLSSPPLPSGYSESITSVDYLSPTGTYVPTTGPGSQCMSNGTTAPQLVTFSVGGPYNTGGNNSFVVQDVCPGVLPPAQLIFLTSPVSGAASSSASLGVMTVEEVDACGDPTTAAATVNLSSSSTGTYEFAASSGGSAITQVTIPSGSSSASFYYGDTAAGTPTITASASGLASATQQETILAGAPKTLKITSSPILGPASSSATVGPITVSEYDAFGNLSTTAETVNLSSSTSGTYEFATSSAGSTITQVTIPSGSSSASFYYGDTLAGTPTITVSAIGFTSATQQETIVAGVANKLAITSGAVSGPASTWITIGPITVKEYDAFGNLSTTAETVNLSSSSTGTYEFATSSGGSAVTSVSIPSGTSTATFYYGDTQVGTPTITVSATGLTSATQRETVTTPPPPSIASPTAATPETLGKHTTTATFTITGAGFARNATVKISGTVVTVTSTTVNSSTSITVTVSSTKTAGTFDLTVTDPGVGSATSTGSIVVS